jgi:hypothetical protein
VLNMSCCCLLSVVCCLLHSLRRYLCFLVDMEVQSLVWCWGVVVNNGTVTVNSEASVLACLSGFPIVTESLVKSL